MACSSLRYQKTKICFPSRVTSFLWPLGSSFEESTGMNSDPRGGPSSTTGACACACACACASSSFATCSCSGVLLMSASAPENTRHCLKLLLRSFPPLTLALKGDRVSSFPSLRSRSAQEEEEDEEEVTQDSTFDVKVIPPLLTLHCTWMYGLDI